MIRCAKCFNDTKSTYFVRDLGVLCYQCGKIYISKTIEDFENLINNTRKIQRNIVKELNDSCPHEHYEETEYCNFKDGKMNPFCRCLDCGAQFIKGENNEI